MAPKRRGGGCAAAPKAKRGRVGNSRQRLEADAGAGSEPPLAVANHPQRLIRFYRSEDDKVFVELTSMWRWFSGNLKSTKGDERLTKTLRRRGYNGASFTAPSRFNFAAEKPWTLVNQLLTGIPTGPMIQ